MAGEIISCPHAPGCSGCSLIGTDLSRQLAWKLQFVRNLFGRAKLGGFTPDRIERIRAASSCAGYRNRVRLAPAPRHGVESGLSLGLYRTGTHEVVDIPGCPVQLEGINETVELLRELLVRNAVNLYDESHQRGDLKYVSVRQGKHTGEQLVGLVTRSAEFPQGQVLARELMDRTASVRGVLHNINPTTGNVIFGSTTKVLAGRDYIEERVCGVRIRLGLTSFFQANTTVAEMIYEAIIHTLALTSSDTLIDLYCGVGAIGLVAARQVAQIIGIEEVGEAVAFAEAAVELNGLDNIAFHRATVEEWLPEFSRLANTSLPGRDSLAVTVNPPRKGLDPGVVDSLIQLRPSRIAYLSCAPRTLLRDLKCLCNGGFRITSVKLFDMFPQTEQIETLAVLRSD